MRGKKVKQLKKGFIEQHGRPPHKKEMQKLKKDYYELKRSS